jgi:hypothetical protein
MNTRKMSRYKCHKIVHAGQITAMVAMQGGFRIDYTGRNGEARFINVKDAWAAKHATAEVGGYLVVYEDGFMSYSPKKAFEDGYSLETDHD